MGNEIVVTHAQTQAVMHLFVGQGSTHEEMKRRAGLLKLEAAILAATFELLDQLGLDANGTDIADTEGRGAP